MRVEAASVTELIDALSRSWITEIDLIADTVYSVSVAYSGMNAFPSITNGRSVTIYGNNAVIQRDPSSENYLRFFHVQNAILTLNGITFRNGLAGPEAESAGGAILAEQTTPSGTEMEINVTACTFDSNGVYATSGGYYGGAIGIDGYWTLSSCRGRVFICNSVFQDNYAGAAGAIHIVNVRHANIQGCRFEENEAIDAGAIGVLGGPTEQIQILDCRFFGNTAAAQGGAISNGGCNMQIVDSMFVGNVAETCAVVSKAASTTQPLTFSNCSIFSNVTSSLESADVFAASPVIPPAVGISAKKCWWGAADGPSGEGAGSGDSVSEYVDYIPYLTSSVPEHEGADYCPIIYTTNDQAMSTNPISLRLGEKRLMEADIRLAKANGGLEFSRTYRQEMLARLTPIGLGWSHNHHFFVNPPTGSGDEKQFTVELPDSGIARFEFLRVNPNDPDVDQYIGATGSTAKANINISTGICKVKTSDRTTYTFQYSATLDVYLLTKRTAASGEELTYTYSSAPEQLLAVVDDFGCRLEFSYYDTADFKDSMVSKVDALRNGILASSVEFDYVETMEDGTPTTPAKPLLAEVTDVRGGIWTYTYYGSSSGEDGDPNPLNFFKKRVSPEISSHDDETIEIETVTYVTADGGATIDGITQSSGDGLLETVFEYHVGTGSNETLETTADSVRRHSFERDILASTVYPDSSIDPERLAGTGVRETGTTFRPSQQTDANGNTTRMVWSERGAFLDFVSDASGATTGFTYEPLQEDDEADLADGGRLQLLTNAIGYKTQYIYDDQLRQPTLILNGSGITETAIKLNDSNTSGSWRKINNSANVTVNELWNQVGHGYLRRIETTDDASGIRSQGFDIVDGKTYDVSVVVRTTQGSCDLRIALNGISGADEDETITASDWTVISFSHTATADASTYLAIETTESSGGSFEVYSASVIEDERAEKINDAFFELPKSASSWSEFGTPAAANQRIAGADAGKKSRRVVTNAADVGIESDTAITLTAGKRYLWIARVFPITGVAKMKLSAAVGAVVETESAGSQMMRWQTLRAVLTTVSSTQSDVRLQILSQGAGAEFIVDSVHVIEFTSIQSWRDFRYDYIWRTLEENSIEVTDASVFQQSQKTYDVSAGRRGLLLSTVQVDTTDSSENRSTTYSYDTAGRQTEIQHSSMLGSCQVSYTVYDEAGNIVASICNYDLSTAPTPTTEPPTDAASATALYKPAYPDKNIVTTHEYDEMNRRFATTSNAGSSYAKTSYSVFDSLNRIRLSVGNYVNPDVMSVPTYTPPYTWTWDESGKVWKDDSTTPQTISHGARLDENIISETVYNERGLVRLQRDVAGHTTLLGYDVANRLIKTVRNAIRPEYDNSVAGDVELALYPGEGHTLSAASDRDIISAQVFDPAGNTVISIQNPDFEDVRIATMNGYDGLNRVVRTIQGASDLEYDFENDHPLINYVPSDDVDQDIVNVTSFDVLGRVDSTTDPHGRVTRTIYDELGRVRLTVQNYVAQYDLIYGAEVDPSAWAWREVSGIYAWRLNSGEIVSHGEDNSENIITGTIYGMEDSSGNLIPDARRNQTRDVLGRLSYRIMDGLGRQVKTIANYVPVGTSDPMDWVWRDDAWHTGPTGSELVNFGADNDQNLISETVYDTDGRVKSTRSTDGNVSRNVYDLNGRQVKTIRNYVEQIDGGLPTDPLDWVWRAVSGDYAWRLSDTDDTLIDHGDRNDFNLISETEYDGQNRAFLTRDSRGLVTRQVYDDSNRVVMTVTNFNPDLADNAPEDWAWRDVASVFEWYTDSDDPVGHGTENDQNIIAATEEFDLLGRVVLTRDVAGLAALRVYDELGRQIRTVTNYVVQGATDPKDWMWRAEGGVWEWYVAAAGSTLVSHGTHNDVNLISDTQYDKAGRVLLTRDSRGTATAYAYDRAGRQRNVTTAAGTGLATTSYTCFDKSGHTLRQIANWIDNGVSPDFQIGDQFVFDPTTHGIDNDQNLIASVKYDGLGRQIETTSAAGSVTQTVYSVDSRVLATVEVGVAAHDGIEDVSTVFRYDGVGRRRMVVQAYLDDDYEDPSEWIWNGSAWLDETGGTPIVHDDGVHTQSQDRNLIVQVGYDVAGRMTSMRTPAGVENAYRYDALGRRITRVLSYTAQGATDPANWVWSTANDRWERGASDTTAVSHGAGGDENMIMQMQYLDLDADDDITGQTRTITTQPDGIDISRDFDRLGRALTIGYDDLAATPDVAFAHDVRSNRVRMTETGESGPVRETLYEHDLARRLIEVGFDTDGDTDVEDVVGYAYDLGGRRTLLAMPGDRDVTYSYDARGQMRTLTDWDSQTSQFRYDAVGRHALTLRANGLRSLYRFDAGGRLRLLRHDAGARLFAQFAYEVDARGNRTEAFEAQRHPGSGTTVIDQSDDSVYYAGAWTTDSGFHVTEQPYASFRLAFAGNGDVELTMGEGPDHGLYDVYVGGSLWQSFNGYAASAGERVIAIPLSNDGAFTLQVNNRADTGSASSGHVMRFKQLSVDAEYTLHTIGYIYDAASRVLGADYYPGENTASTPAQTFAYEYDVAGNLTDNNGTARTFNKLNQISSGGVSYDDNGNMTSDGANTYTWDRANRLLSIGLLSYTYDGLGNRLSQILDATPSDIVTNYLLDIQPSLVQVIAATIDSDSENYIHSLRGIHATQDIADDWHNTLQDGLGSVRSEIGAALAIGVAGTYEPYGLPIDVDGAYSQPFRFTGEMRDENTLQFHSARFFSPSLGSWLSIDPIDELGNLVTYNKYEYSSGNPINMVDYSGLFSCSNESTDMQSACADLDKALQRAAIKGLTWANINAAVQNNSLLLRDLELAAEQIFGIPLVLSSNFLSNANINYEDCSTAPNVNIGSLGGNALELTKQTLTRSVAALVHIVTKFESVQVPLTAVRQWLTRDVIVLLSNDVTGNAYQGYVDLLVPNNNLIHLGGGVNVGTIVHELGHSFDRNFQLRASAPIKGLFLDRYRRQPTYDSTVSGANPVQDGDGMTGRASVSLDPEEIWADMFMTWVLDGQELPARGNSPDFAKWKWTQSREASFKRAYTLLSTHHLLLGMAGPPLVGASNEDKLKWVKRITDLIFTGGPGGDY
ncbi:MAG: hypothetical protein IPK52_26160 [Chloroflexi bacterium]|nr:hypothetical protein [Chloroflexota bacterium]